MERLTTDQIVERTKAEMVETMRRHWATKNRHKFSTLDVARRKALEIDFNKELENIGWFVHIHTHGYICMTIDGFNDLPKGQQKKIMSLE